ncbi:MULTISPECIES: hypothetical protein [unclassified Acidocella]|uniref:hypothetical protein n=1 Tax=unclassified Acidocella TaxID=2648610 RepID=UPI00028CDA5F|nr:MULTISPECIES: hypothetical protein [unclassified Acidocella]EKN00726.1 hypothetical protein MXAZACID_03921 [Acidocella sp. MX-AZ02]WBO60253.1 hypothetical protein GT370_05390 [Acidocella sp. MX-AZ03]
MSEFGWERGQSLGYGLALDAQPSCGVRLANAISFQHDHLLFAIRQLSVCHPSRMVAKLCLISGSEMMFADKVVDVAIN